MQTGEIESYMNSLGNVEKPADTYDTHVRRKANDRSKATWELQWQQYNQAQADYRNFMLAQLQHNYALEARAYDSPYNQINRLKQAGLNPNLAYGQLQDSSTPSFSYSPSSAAGVPSGSVSSGLDDVASALGALSSIQSAFDPSRYYQMRLAQNQLDFQQMQMKAKTIDLQRQEAELVKTLVHSNWMKHLSSEDQKTLDYVLTRHAIELPYNESKVSSLRANDAIANQAGKIYAGNGDLASYYMDYYKIQGEIQKYDRDVAEINAKFASDDRERRKKIDEASNSFSLEVNKLKESVDNPLLRALLSWISQNGLPSLPGFSFSDSSTSSSYKGRSNSSRSRSFSIR